jgi:hypothetical protein
MLAICETNGMIMNENQKTEFEWFDSVQSKLADAFLKEGFTPSESQELGFLMAQGIRDVPALLSLLEEPERHSNNEILDAVHLVLSNRASLIEVARMLRIEA